MKVLLLDIETSPNLAYVWGVWEQNINLSNMVATSTVLCWSAKWLGNDEVMYSSIFDSSPKQMLKRMHRLLDETDVVVHYNGKRFDIPTLNREFLLVGMNPPAPYKQVDVLSVMRERFRFMSNKLNYVAGQLKLGEKEKHDGIQLWIDCLARKPEAWATMKKYNMKDVILLEKLYLRVLPWISNHPNRAQYDDGAVCPNCGENKKQRRGIRKGQQRYQCVPCGTWFNQNAKGNFVHARG